jgi:hypothetical protein
MLSWIIQITIISIILIFLVHHLINFFKSTLTVPKIKDLVNTPNKKYENMYGIIHNTNNMETATYRPISFALKSLNIISYWDYPIDNRECGLCKGSLQAPSSQELTGSDKYKYVIDTEIAVGECKHMFHKKCIDNFVLTTGTICPIDKTGWKESHVIKSNNICKD